MAYEFPARKKKRCLDFTEADKVKLIRLVKEAPPLWDLSDVSHNNAKAIDAAWTQIGNKMGKSKETCKKAWFSLRDAFRYYTKVSQKAHINQTNGDPLRKESGCTIDWPFAKDMAFLEKNRARVEMYRKRKLAVTVMDATDEDEDVSQQGYFVKEEETVIPMHNEMEDYQQIQEDAFDLEATMPSLCSSVDETAQSLHTNEDYEQNNHDSPEIEHTDNSDILKKLDQLINMQKSNGPRPHVQTNSANGLVYRKQLVACDALLQQLPTEIAETTLVDLQNYILKKINDNHKRSRVTSI